MENQKLNDEIELMLNFKKSLVIDNIGSLYRNWYNNKLYLDISCYNGDLRYNPRHCTIYSYFGIDKFIVNLRKAFNCYQLLKDFSYNGVINVDEHIRITQYGVSIFVYDSSVEISLFDKTLRNETDLIELENTWNTVKKILSIHIIDEIDKIEGSDEERHKVLKSIITSIL